MRASGRFTPRWELLYQNAGDNVTGTPSQSYPVGDPRAITRVVWDTDGSSISATAASNSIDSLDAYGSLNVSTDRIFPQATRIKFDARPSNAYAATIGVGFGAGPEVWSNRDPGFAVVCGYTTRSVSDACFRVEDYYRGDVVNGAQVLVPFSNPYPSTQANWFTVRAVCFGRFVTMKVTGAALSRPLYATMGCDQNLVADRLRLQACPAMGFGQTSAYATRIKNISVWTADILGELPS